MIRDLNLNWTRDRNEVLSGVHGLVGTFFEQFLDSLNSDVICSGPFSYSSCRLEKCFHRHRVVSWAKSKYERKQKVVAESVKSQIKHGNWFHEEITELSVKKASTPLVYGWLALWTLAKLIQTAFYVKYFNSTGKVCACLHSWGIITVSIEPWIPVAPALSCLTNTKTGEVVHSSLFQTTCLSFTSRSVRRVTSRRWSCSDSDGRPVNSSLESLARSFCNLMCTVLTIFCLVRIFF